MDHDFGLVERLHAVALTQGRPRHRVREVIVQGGAWLGIAALCALCWVGLADVLHRIAR